MRATFLIWILFFACNTFAATTVKKVALSLGEQARLESQQIGIIKPTATDAQVPGMLSLKDPQPENETRNWTYFASLRGQTFQAQGKIQKLGSGIFDLEKNSQTVLPTMELGVTSHPLGLSPVKIKMGLSARAGLASQESIVILDSGYKINDARLNSTLLSAGPAFELLWEKLPRVRLTFSSQIGRFIYTQTSANEFANFSRQAEFQAANMGFEFALSKKWSFITEWSQKTSRSNTEIALQKESFEMGTKVAW